MKVKILVVDDDESTVLLKQGYRVDNVQSRCAALKSGHSPVERLRCELLRGKLEQKMRELERERQARRRCEDDYQQLKGMMQQLIAEAVAEQRKKDDQLILRGRQRLMAEMVNNIAHQWRQPINLLGLLAQELKMNCEHGCLTGEFVERNLKRTMEVVKGMSSAIDDLNSLFRQEKEKVRFRLLEVVGRVEALLKGSFEARGVRLQVETSCDPTLTGYPGLISQALVSILVNARDAFGERQEGERSVALRVAHEGERTVITVTDTAGGIPGEIIGKVFDPYFTTKRASQGSGIGLFISKSIIEKGMGGSLSARNVGKGAEFRIVL